MSSTIIPPYAYRATETRSMFPTFPRDRAISSTSFSVSFLSPSLPSHVLNRGKSFTLSLFNRIMNQHAQNINEHDGKEEMRTTTSSTSTTQLTSHISSFINQHVHDIARINVTGSRRSDNMFTFYVHCTDTTARDALANAIQTHTTLKCELTYQQVIVGKVGPIPYMISSDTLLSHFLPFVPSIHLTRILASYPSCHYREYVFFSVSVSDVSHLQHIPPLPGMHTPLIWEKFRRPKTVMCSLCHTQGHTRSKCSHLLTPNARFCANCGEQSHVTRVCTKPKTCRCCHVSGHIVFDCPDYKPQWSPIKPNLVEASFPPLSRPTSSSASPISPSLSADFATSRSSSPSSVHPRLPHKRSRHQSFDSESISSYESRDDRMVSSALQQHLDGQSLTRRTITSTHSIIITCIINIFNTISTRTGIGTDSETTTGTNTNIATTTRRNESTHETTHNTTNSIHGGISCVNINNHSTNNSNINNNNSSSSNDHLI